MTTPHKFPRIRPTQENPPDDDWSESDKQDDFISGQEYRLEKVQNELLRDMLAHIDAAAGLLKVVTETLPQSSIRYKYRRQVTTLTAIAQEIYLVKSSMGK